MTVASRSPGSTPPRSADQPSPHVTCFGMRARRAPTVPARAGQSPEGAVVQSADPLASRPVASALGIAGAWAVTPAVRSDRRGSVTELFTPQVLRECAGFNLMPQQANVFVSRRRALRGIAFAQSPPGQAKLVSCVRGAVLDAVVDLRVGSPTFGRWHLQHLTGREPAALLLAEGLGHACLALADDTTVVYLLSQPHDPAREHTLDPLDPELGIAWPTDIAPVLGTRAPLSLRQALDRQLLPHDAPTPG
ncbi:dTDP-4-dehydrorhamnose 3,5-epimerase family protein [Kitasatospora sp. NPDC058965]|uniref:dTDP-4-dehydrorhamnose 3,5-epimerase family protein n=1 Tax=Kitasatospora sp. NPDC058965 TaxID=3346682 RepID=UPI003689BF56